MTRLGLIGYPLGHSFSAEYFREKFRALHIEGKYELYPLTDIRSFPDLLTDNPDLQGLNVTIPYKEAILPYLDTLSAEASVIGAVNVIKIEYDSTGRRILSGHNSDWKGFADSLAPLTRPDIRHALVLGTGGASKAVSYALMKSGITVTNVSRTPVQGKSIGYQDLDNKLISDHLMIVNTTPLGMYPQTGSYPPIPYQALTSRHICYDLVYNPEETMFMKKSAEHGATVKNGLEMLHRQADTAWSIWNDKTDMS